MKRVFENEITKTNPFMKKEIYHLTVALLLLTPFFTSLSAQDNLAVDFVDLTTVPDFLNICGDPDTEVVRISVDGLAPDTRTNIQATANLFRGVEFVSFDPANSSVGVTLIDITDRTRPVFGIPDLSPFGTISVDIAFSVAANCEYTDTLTANNAAVVLDTWDFVYDMGGTIGMTESDNNVEYRDAFAIPSFTLSVNNPVDAGRVGECYTRELVSANTGLDGFVDTIFYSNLQGPGVYVESIEVNGIPLTITKTLDVSGDTLITGIIDGPFFMANTVGTGMPGDGDVFFDPSELITITEQICILDCFEDRGSDHTVEWGCNGRSCTTTGITDFAEIGQGAANPTFQNSGTLANQNTGYCQAGNSTVTFTNDGIEVDAGFATMIDVSTGIGLGNLFELSNGGFTITGIRIAGVDIATLSPMVDLDNHPQFASDPDGAGGLTDFDGDGFFDDLPQNESIEITAFYEFDCTMAQELGSDESCPNSFSTSFNARIDHTNACDERLVRLETSYFRPSNTRSNVENFNTPDAFAVTDTFYITHTQSRGVRFFEKNCGGAEEFYVTVVAPTGVNLVPGVTEVIRNEATSFPLISNTQSNDTLFLAFNGSITAFLNGDYTLQLAFQADCTAPLGPTNFPVEFGYYCPSCDCRHTWFCGDLTGPQLHSTNPPCPDVACPVGLKTTEFSVNRTTLGYTDDSYSTRIHPDSANRKVAISCDSVAMRIMNIVGDTPLTDSIGMVITYNNIDESLDPTETFLFDYGTLRITNGGTEFLCTVDTSVLQVDQVDSTKILTFDLDSCLVSLGITLQPGDTVDFLANFTVNPEGPYPVQFKRVPNLRGYGYGRVAGVNEACDNFGDIFTIAKNQTVFDFPNSNNFPEGCEETFLQYRLITINNGFTEEFGNEYRQAIGVDSITFTFDTAILESYTIFEPEVSIPNHPIHGNNFFPVPGFDLFPSGQYIARFDTLTVVPALNNVQSYSFNFRIRAVPNCRSLTGSSNGDNRFDFDPKIHFVDRYYATEIGDGSCAEIQIDSVDNDIFYTDPPTFAYNYVSNSNYTLFGDTAVWTVQHCNTSFTADAGITWFAIEDPSGSIEVVEMQDISDPANITTLPFNAYGSTGNNYYAFTPGVVKADGSALISDVCNTIQIKALVNQCGTTNFTSRVGWNCIMFTEPAWTPELYPPCDDEQLPLSVTTQDPFLDANIIEQPTANPDICDTIPIAIIVKNTGQGTAFDVQTQLILPLEGMAIVPGSVEFAYPSDAPLVPVATDPSFVGTSSRGLIYQYDNFADLDANLHANGLPGFSPLYSEDTTQFIIRYKAVTDCDFVSGSISYYAFQGMKGCGDSTNYETGETLPLVINGADPGVSKIFDVHFAEGTNLIPGGSSTLEITAENLTVTPTDTTDKILLRLPLNVDYQPGSTVALEPAGWMITEPEIDTVAGFKYFYWCMPANIMQNDSVRMSLTVDSPDYACDQDTLEVGLFTVLRQTLTCSVSGMDCVVESYTSSNNGQLTGLPISQRALTFDFNYISSTCQNGNQELITIDGNIVNNGTDFPNLPFTVRYYHDLDGSGDISAGDPELDNFTESGPISAGDSLPFIHQLTVNANEVCAIVGEIDTTGLNLCGNGMSFVSEPQLLNAGTDELFCADTPTTITTNLGDPNCNSLSAYTYNWLAIAPASTSDLSATNIPDPVLNVPHNATVEDTLRYILETTRPGCASVTRDTVNIIRGLGITVDLGPTIYVMAGGNTTLCPMVTGGTAPYTYSWAADPTLSDPNIETPIATPVLDTTQYTVTVTSATGCTGTDIVSVIIGNAITAGVNPTDTTICAEASLNLMASGGTDYEWLEDAANPTTGNLSATNIPNPVFSGGLPASTYIYRVAVTDVAFPGFSDTALVTINTFAAPTIGILATPGTFICSNENITLQASGADTYIWTDAASGITLGTNDVLVDAPTVTTTYEVTGTDANGCTGTQQITITVDPIVLNITASANNICPGDTVTLTGGTADQLDWFENGMLIGTGTSVEVSPILTTDYTLVGQNASGCTDSTIFTVDVLPSPTVLTPQADITACNQSTFPISLELDQNIQFYTITGSGSTANEVVNGNILTFDALYLPDTSSFIVTLVGATDGCSITESFRILPCPCIPPSLNSIAIIEASCGNADGSAVIHMVENDSGYVYNWAPDLGIAQGIGNERTNLPFGGYVVQVVDTANAMCSTEIYVMITNSDGPEASAATTPATCADSDGTATLAPAGFDYLWSAPPNANFRDDLSTGTYFVTFTDPAAPDCPNVMMVEIDEDNPLEANLTVTATPDCGVANGGVQIDVLNGSGAYTFSWGDGLNTTSNVRVGLAAGTYVVTITDTGSSGCELIFPFMLSNNLMTATVSIDSVTAASCHDAADGIVAFDVTYDVAFVGPADTMITDGFFSYENGNLPAGEYCIVISDNNGCIAAGDCFTVEEPEAMDLHFVIGPDCGDGTGTIEVRVNGGTEPFIYDWLDVPGDSNEANRDSLMADTFALTVVDSLGCVIAENSVIVPSCTDSCEYFGGLDSLMLQANSCDGFAEYCFSLPFNDVLQYTILDNGQPYTGPLDGCDFDSLILYSYSGLFWARKSRPL